MFIRLEDDLWKSVLSFYRMCSKDQTQVAGMGGRHGDPMGQLSSPRTVFISNQFGSLCWQASPERQARVCLTLLSNIPCVWTPGSHKGLSR